MYLQDRTSDFVCICQVCFHIAEMASPRSTAGHRGYDEGTDTMNNVTKLVKECKACLIYNYKQECFINEGGNCQYERSAIVGLSSFTKKFLLIVQRFDYAKV